MAGNRGPVLTGGKRAKPRSRPDRGSFPDFRGSSFSPSDGGRYYNSVFSWTGRYDKTPGPFGNTCLKQVLFFVKKLTKEVLRGSAALFPVVGGGGASVCGRLSGSSGIAFSQGPHGLSTTNDAWFEIPWLTPAPGHGLRAVESEASSRGERLSAP